MSLVKNLKSKKTLNLIICCMLATILITTVNSISELNSSERQFVVGPPPPTQKVFFGATNLVPPTTVVSPPVVTNIINPPVQEVISNSSSTTSNILPFYMLFAKLAYCNGKIIKTTTCSFCDNLKGYTTFITHSIKDQTGRRFLFAILINDQKAEVVITFSGPKTENSGSLFSDIYSKGFTTVSDLDNIRVETSYWEIYSKLLRIMLQTKVKEVQLNQRSGYKFKFVGHSFGGSLAILAAFDLKRRGVLEKVPQVYTFGQLRIGDLNFVNTVNQHLQIIKVVKDNDYITRSPNCFFANGRYNCESNINNMFARLPELRSYYTSYFSNISPLLENNPFLFSNPCFGPDLPIIRNMIPAVQVPNINIEVKKLIEAEAINEGNYQQQQPNQNLNQFNNNPNDNSNLIKNNSILNNQPQTQTQTNNTDKNTNTNAITDNKTSNDEKAKQEQVDALKTANSNPRLTGTEKFLKENETPRLHKDTTETLKKDENNAQLNNQIKARTNIINNTSTDSNSSSEAHEQADNTSNDNNVDNSEDATMRFKELNNKVEKTL